jgi:hypothetical protein
MDVWQLILYVGASLLALSSLVSLMSHHRRQHRRQLLLEYEKQLAANPQPVEPVTESNVSERANAAA